MSMTFAGDRRGVRALDIGVEEMAFSATIFSDVVPGACNSETKLVEFHRSMGLGMAFGSMA